MIEMYTGTPGSGKSLHCAKVVYDKLCRGKNVIANFDVNVSALPARRKLGMFLYIDNCDMSPKLLVQFAMKYHKKNTNGHIVEGQTLLVIDECQILFNARDWQAPNRMQWATFFTQHRKFGFDIILITQFDRLVDRQIRSLVEYQVIHRKISNFKTIGFFLGLFCKGNVFVAVTQWYGLHERCDSEFFVMREKYARLYDSYKIFNGVMAPVTAGAQPAGGVSGAPAEDCAPDVTDPVDDADNSSDDLVSDTPELVVKTPRRAAPDQAQKQKTRQQPSTVPPVLVELPSAPARWKPEVIKVSDDDIPMPETAN